MTIFSLGTGRYSVAQSTKPSGLPCLTIRRLPSRTETGTLLEPCEPGAAEDYDLIIAVETPVAAAVLLTVAQAIAFAHGIEPK